MEAELIIKFRFLNVCSERDLKDTGMTFEEMVKYLIREEGLFGICEDDYEILEVREVDGSGSSPTKSGRSPDAIPRLD